jgi:hypothetical protein
LQWQIRHVLSVPTVGALLILLGGSAAVCQSRNDQGDLAERDAPPIPLTVRRALDARLASEAKATKIDTEPSDRFPMVVCDSGRCGAINRNGTWAVIPAYDGVELFREGRAVVEMRKPYSYVYGFVDDAGRIIARPQYTAVGHFSHGFAQIEVEDRIGLIDREGQVAVWPRVGFVVPFTSNLFWTTEDREVAAGNSVKRQLLFDDPSFSFNGKIDTFIKPKGRWGLIDRSGAWVRKPEFLAVRFFDYEGSQFMWVRTDAGWGLMCSDLSWQIEPKFEQVGIASQEMASVSTGGHWGFVDASGKLAIEPRFDRVLPFSGPYAPAQKDKLFGLIDRTGAWVFEPTYDWIYSHKSLIPKSWWTIKSGERFGLLDDAFHVIVAPEFDQSPAMCTDGRILVFKDKKPLLLSRDGRRSDDTVDCDSMISTRR